MLIELLDWQIRTSSSLHKADGGPSFFCPSCFRPAFLSLYQTKNSMEKTTKRLRWTEAYKLMNARDEKGHPKPFDIRFVCRDGTVSECRVKRTFSYNRRTGMRRLLLENGEFRNVYDVLILQINSTKILVK